LVTSQTSLLILETLEQYLKYLIFPPKSLPLIQIQFIQQMETKKQQLKEQQNQKLENVKYT
jgi:hypothetical protein